MDFKITLIKGDGIGPEIVDSAVAVLERISEIYGHKFYLTRFLPEEYLLILSECP